MQIIIISSKNTKHKQLDISFFQLMSFSVLAIMITAFLINAFIEYGTDSDIPRYISAETAISTENFPAEQFDIYGPEIDTYYAQRLGQLQAESIRLKAISEKIAQAAGMDLSSFNLDEEPGQGGVDDSGQIMSGITLQSALVELKDSFTHQSEQLSFLERYYLTAGSIESTIPQGSPVKKGWISSYYGNRIDPFNGKKTFHHGLDFAGKKGSEIFAVAEGIVSWTGTRSGYGKMIDIDHGNGYITRYAHAKELIVEVGERVQKGKAIAIMGSTGRSTGPHVHFEVLRDGKTLNPYTFVKG